jgi:Ca-activated chloride channel family protein
MNFENPLILLLLFCLPVGGGFLVWRERKSQALIRQLGPANSLKDIFIGFKDDSRFWKSSLWLAVLAMIILALARPVWGMSIEVIDAHAVEIMAVLDVSASMDAQDTQPSRLERAKLDLRDLFERLPGHQVGLILFAGSPMLYLPLSADPTSANSFLNAIDTTSITHQGTGIEAALRLAVDSFGDRRDTTRVVLLLSDGEEHTGDQLAALEAARSAGIILSAIGYGSLEGALIPLRDNTGKAAGYKTNRAGEQVRSVLTERNLKLLAERGGGTYQRAGQSAIPQFVTQIERLQVANNSVGGGRERPVERFEIFVALAALALTIEMRLNGIFRLGKIGLLLMLTACGVNAAERNNAANQLYGQANDRAAIQAYYAAQVAAPDAPEPYYNAASPLLRAGEFQQAVRALRQALRHSDRAMSARVYYNLGNVYFEAGRYEDAIAAYQQALLRQPDDSDARHNLELAWQRMLSVTPTTTEAGVTPPGTTPTPQGSLSQRPTPTSQPGTMNAPMTLTPSTGNTLTTPILASGFDTTMSIEEADRRLDALQESQKLLPLHQASTPPTDTATDKDW